MTATGEAIDSTEVQRLFHNLTTPHVADSCLRRGVDVRCAALERASPGDVLIVDNEGRQDEACVGLHRNTPELVEIGLPMFSLGGLPTGPLRADEREADALLSARVGRWLVSANDVAMSDENGVLFVSLTRAEEIATAARSIRDTERAQAEKMRQGTSLRVQLQFAEFISRRSSNPGLTCRQHVRRIGGAIGE
jgi:4-hydroxy-4-methyl-2-oxoglutarate aldolase